MRCPLLGVFLIPPVLLVVADSGEKVLKAIPTPDALILHIAIILLSVEKGKTISELVAELPQRCTYSNHHKNFPMEKSRAKLTIGLSRRPSPEQRLRQVAP